MDTQVTELLGRNRLITELLQAGLEVAVPLRDRGVDLLAYVDQHEDSHFYACPIQMKAATTAVFSIDDKYAKFPNLILAYVWGVGGGQPVTYALTHGEALSVAEDKGWTATASWTEGKKYSNTRPGKDLQSRLEPFLMTPEKWFEKVAGQTKEVRAALVRSGAKT